MRFLCRSTPGGGPSALPSWRPLSGLLFIGLLSLPSVALAQWDDEGDAGGGGGGAIIDPELQGVAPPPKPLPEVPTVVDAGDSGELRLVLRNRTSADVFMQEPREDVLTSTFLADFQATVRRSEKLRYVVGARPVYRVATRRQATSDQGATRYELDVLPSAAYGDWNPAAGLHLRIGYQYQHLGRFDVFSTQNVLSAFDLREGPNTLPEAAELAQPAVRVDWDPNLWLSLRAVVLPFFVPHVVTFTDSDYALAPSTQAEVDANFDMLADGNPNQAAYLRELFKTSLSRSGQHAIAQTGFSALAPDPELSRPQAALRAVMHGPEGELGMTVVAAGERLPAPTYSETALRVLDAWSVGRRDVRAENDLRSDTQPLRFEYNRFFVTAVDGATHVGPVQLGAELGVMWNRTLFSARRDFVLRPEQVHVAQASLRAEYLLGERLALVGEGFFATTLAAPDDPERVWLMAAAGRHLFGGVLFASYAWAAPGLTFEFGTVTLNGPSHVLLPRVQWKARPDLSFELGGQWVQGDKPQDLTQPNFSIGGRYDDTDQIYIGVRYLQ